MHRVLLLGGHGKVALYLTPKLLSRSWQVTSIVRNADHEVDIRAAAGNQPGKLDVLTRSLDDVQTEQQAQSIINETKPDYVVWSAGAGGKGGPSRAYAIDRDAAQAFIRASVRTPSVTKFLMVSYIGSRRNRAPWWDDEDWAHSLHVNNKILPDYAKAKVAADECLVALASQRKDIQAIVLRPGTLSDEPETNKVKMGHVSPRGKITRADVAQVAALLLDQDGARGYFDLMGGEEDAEKEVKKMVEHKVDCIEGEDVKAIEGMYKL